MTPKLNLSLEEALSTLTEALALREKELDEREQKLEQYEKRLEAEHSLAYGETAPNDVLHLNVGGTKTTVLRRTLTSVPGSMLASRFSGRWDDSLEKDEDGHFFIDQDFTLFRMMLTYLRNKANGDEKFPMKSPSFIAKDQDRFNFYRMVEYYGMTEGIYPTKVTAITLRKGDSTVIVGPKKAFAKEWSTFGLDLDGHSRAIKSFEVTLGEVQRIQIGWGMPGSISSETDNLGVGEVRYSFALDLTRSSFINEGILSAIDGLEHPKETVVLSQDYGRRWFVNGELVFDVGSEVNSGNKTPLISIKGEFEVTSVELDN